MTIPSHFTVNVHEETGTTSGSPLITRAFLVVCLVAFAFGMKASLPILRRCGKGPQRGTHRGDR